MKMIKIWCEKCNGTGKIPYLNNENEIEKCRHCAGKGFNESESLQRQVEIAKAIILWFSTDRIIESFSIEIWSIEELLEWAESEQIQPTKNIMVLDGHVVNVQTKRW